MPRKRTFTFGLSPSAVKHAIINMQGYLNDLYEKNKEFVYRLCNIAVDVIEKNMVTPGDSDPSHTTAIYISGGGTSIKGVVRLNGEDVLFIEFGAGITYNGPAGQSPHPKGAELGYTIGDYGYHLGRLSSWRYQDSNGEWRVSYGTKAAMPMYKAGQAIRQNIRKVAADVFGKNYRTPRIALHDYDV